MQKLNLTIDDQAADGLENLTRAFSASAFVRVMLKAISMSERDFEKYKVSSKEAQEVRSYLREKTRLKNLRGLLL